MRGSEAALSWLWFRRGLRRELRLPLLTLALAGAAAGGVALFSAQLDRSVQLAANSALGADLELRAHEPLPSSLNALAARLGLKTTTVTTFPTVAVAGKRLKLASLRAVAAPYPLRGEIVLETAPNAPHRVATGVPPRGTVWTSAALAAALALKPGETLTLGRERFRLGALIVRAPGAALDLAGIAPLLVVNVSDLSATGLTGPQSRVRHKLLLAGPPAALAEFRAQAKPPTGAEFRDASEVIPGLGSPLKGTRDFLRLAVLATLLIAAAALFQSARHYLVRQRKTAAILQTLGAGKGRVRGLYVLELLWLALAASAIGVVCAWGIARGLAALTALWFGFVPASVPPTTLVVAPVTVALLASGLWLAPIVTLAAQRPAAVLRGATAGRRIQAFELFAIAAAIAALVFWRGADSLRLTLWTLAAAVALGLIIAGIAYALIRVLGAPAASLRPAWRYGAGQLGRRRAQSLAELVAFGLSIAAILLLTGVRHDLVSSWRARLPANAPDHFIINIQPVQREPISRFFAAHGIEGTKLYPMVKARLVAINGVPATQWKSRVNGEHGRELLLREQTLSMRDKLGTGNELTAGRWWTKQDRGRPLVSAEANWAKALGVGLSDTIEFSVAGQTLKLRIASLRKIKWQSFEPNFFLVTPPASLDGFPATWITAIHTGGGDQLALDLVHRFPNLTVINVTTIINAVTKLLRHAALALAVVFGLATLAAVLVLLAALEAGRVERARELALMRVLGARRRLLATTLGAEFALLGCIAGLGAGLAAAGAGYALGRWVFDLAPAFDGWLVLIGGVAGAIVIGGAGLAATLGLTRAPAAALLRRTF